MKWIKAGILLVMLAFVFFFIRATDMSKVAASLQQVGYRFIYTLLITFLAYWLATVGWRFCMEMKNRHLSTGYLFLVRHVGETTGFINPTGVIGGEAVKVYLLHNKGIEKQSVILSVLISRLLTIGTQVLMFFIALVILLASSFRFSFTLPTFFSALSVVIIIGCLLLSWYISKSVFVKNLLQANKFGHTILAYYGRLKLKLMEWRMAFTQFIRQNPKAVGQASLYFMAHWLLGSLEFYIILHLLGVPTGVMQALLVDMGVIFFKAAGAFVPGQVGVEEYGNKIMLALIGIADMDIWVTASILRRTRQVFWIAFGVIAYLLLQNRKELLKKK
jgi:glycosyltransferase 2 family protein